MSTLFNAQLEILAELAAIIEPIEPHRPAVFLLERERLTLQNRMRLTSWAPSKHEVRE